MLLEQGNTAPGLDERKDFPYDRSMHANRTGIVSTITQVIISWDEEFAALNAKGNEVDPRSETCPRLKTQLTKNG